MSKKNKTPTTLLDICILTSGCVDLFEKCIDAVLTQHKSVSSRIHVMINCPPVTFLLAITLGPIALFYVWTIIEWWRGKDF